MRISPSFKSFLAFSFIFCLLEGVAVADSGIGKSKNPTSNIYGVKKEAIEDSFGEKGKKIDLSDFEHKEKDNDEVKDEQKLEKTNKEVPDFDTLTVPTETNPIKLPPEENAKDKWQEF